MAVIEAIKSILGALSVQVRVFVSLGTPGARRAAGDVDVVVGVEAVGQPLADTVVASLAGISGSMVLPLIAEEWDGEGPNPFSDVSVSVSQPSVSDVDASSSGDGGKELSDASKAIIGGVVGGVALLLMIAVVLVVIRKNRVGGRGGKAAHGAVGDNLAAHKAAAARTGQVYSNPVYKQNQ